MEIHKSQANLTRCAVGQGVVAFSGKVNQKKKIKRVLVLFSLRGLGGNNVGMTARSKHMTLYLYRVCVVRGEVSLVKLCNHQFPLKSRGHLIINWPCRHFSMHNDTAASVSLHCSNGCHSYYYQPLSDPVIPSRMEKVRCSLMSIIQ